VSDQVPPEEVARVLRAQAASVAEAKARLAASEQRPPEGPSVADRIRALVAQLRSRVSVPQTPEDLARPLPNALFPHEALEKKRKQQAELTKNVD
jgi:hypothetical protein